MTILKGFSFPIADLILVGAWSEAHSMRMIVRLDHGSEDELYEEVLALYPTGSAVCCWLVWREADAVLVQPMLGRSQRHASVIDMLETLMPPKPVAQTQIRATRWPNSYYSERTTG
jgi:hypothetical protein